MKTSEVAGRFIADIFRTAAVADEDANRSTAERESMERYVEREYLCRVYSRRSQEADERLREVTFGFLRGTETPEVFKRVVSEHCFIWNIRAYEVPGQGSLVVLVEGAGAGEPCSWDEFAAANSDAFAPAELSYIRDVLLRGEVFEHGGGAAPLMKVSRVVASEVNDTALPQASGPRPKAR